MRVGPRLMGKIVASRWQLCISLAGSQLLQRVSFRCMWTAQLLLARLASALLVHLSLTLWTAIATATECHRPSPHHHRVGARKQIDTRYD
jgi:hypothetical protein